LISSNLTGYNALCGLRFSSRVFHRSSIAIAGRSRSSRLLQRSRTCIVFRVDLAPRVPLATVEINGTWLNQIVLDSGMSGGGALWDGVRERLRSPFAFGRKRHGSAADAPVSPAELPLSCDSRWGRLRAPCRCVPKRSARRLQRDYRDESARRTRYGGRLPAPANLLRRRKLSKAWSRFNNLRSP